MKKIFLLAIFFIVSANVSAKTKFDPDCRSSSFDGAVTCSVKPFGTYVENARSRSETVSLGGIWTSKGPDEVAIMINLGYIAANINQVSFNLDGVVETFKVDLNNNSVTHRGPVPYTSSMVVIPLDYLGKIVNANESKYRVTTLSSGYREGRLQGKGEQSGLLALRSIYDRAILEKEKIIEK